MLTDHQRKTLLRIARKSIAAALTGRRYEVDPAELDDELMRPSGAFVTLTTRDDQLRGCIGSIQPVAPLYQAVSSNAVNAACRDPRFHPVSPEELSALHLEISVMGPVEPVEDVAEIVVGRDGLIVSRRPYGGLLLPQVATDHAWDRDTFLSQTCVKAGLPPNAWRSPDCRIEKFSAEVFGEETAHK